MLPVSERNLLREPLETCSASRSERSPRAPRWSSLRVFRVRNEQRAFERSTWFFGTYGNLPRRSRDAMVSAHNSLSIAPISRYGSIAQREKPRNAKKRDGVERRHRRQHQEKGAISSTAHLIYSRNVHGPNYHV